MDRKVQKKNSPIGCNLPIPLSPSIHCSLKIPHKSATIGKARRSVSRSPAPHNSSVSSKMELCSQDFPTMGGLGRLHHYTGSTDIGGTPVITQIHHCVLYTSVPPGKAGIHTHEIPFAPSPSFQQRHRPNATPYRFFSCHHDCFVHSDCNTHVFFGHFRLVDSPD